ncbi:heterokaryon incompatibility protein-domain-containing protein [Podospora didyma]|uniref:Heterokaryon incompatibility protein-domain-containing protein n=1 Tax=Podospora didyma TaxID=330526 RepID=A0AAE0U3W9_9PEZI|nr:heterokaryon incompatibility protein-domain-containing protein [Podospora didyma]
MAPQDVCEHCGSWTKQAPYSLRLDPAWLKEQHELDQQDCPDRCRYCQVLAQVILRNISADKMGYARLYVSSAEVDSDSDEDGDAGGVSPGSLRIYAVGTLELEIELEIFVDRESSAIPNLPCIPTTGPTRSDSDESFAFIRACLDSCLSRHFFCRRPVPPPPMPRRVLRIDKKKLAQDGRIMLYEPQGEFRADYIALSHCWGKHQPLRMLTLNRESFIQAGIPLTKLSAVFRDAVEVCRRMDLEYLWIDSLCIIQDSKEDWERESARMCEYYENALFTILAASSPDGSIPFLRECPERWRPQVFPSVFVGSDGKKVSVVARHCPRGLNFSSETIRKMVEDDEALQTRAWAFQEGQVSKRAVAYTGGKLVWTCHTIRGMEENGREAGPIADNLCNRTLFNLSDIFGDGEDDALKIWEELVVGFSSRELTYATDCLPALSGLAKKFHIQLGWRYVAGMWEKHLAVYLCWQVETLLMRYEPVGQTAASNNDYIAPTWAWPSAGGQRIQFRGRVGGIYENMATVEEVSCQVDGLNPFGRVVSGHLVLTGMVFTILLSQQAIKEVNWVSRADSKPEAIVVEDCTLVQRGSDIYRARPGESFLPFSDVPVLCLILGGHSVASNVSKSAIDDDRTRYYGLVLGSSGKDGVYHRLGLAAFKPRDVSSDILAGITPRTTVRIE